MILSLVVVVVHMLTAALYTAEQKEWKNIACCEVHSKSFIHSHLFIKIIRKTSHCVFVKRMCEGNIEHRHPLDVAAVCMWLLVRLYANVWMCVCIKTVPERPSTHTRVKQRSNEHTSFTLRRHTGRNIHTVVYVEHLKRKVFFRK